MKDRLEKYIEDNRNEFDMREPSADLWNKIAANQNQPKVRRLNASVLWRVAAVIVIFLTGFLVQEIRYNIGGDNTLQMAQEKQEVVIPELQETEAYYAHQVSMMMNEVERYSVNDPGIYEEVKYDLTELDSVYSELKEDLKENVANDEVIEAMIQNYRIKLQILEDLLSELKQINEETNLNQRVDYEL